MDITSYLNLLSEDYTLQVITLGTTILGASCGMLGSFAVLRKQSLLGDAISHAALPGIALAFILLGTKNSIAILLGALVSGLVGTFWIRGMIKNTRLKSDTALGLVLSIFFGVGMLLLTYIQKQPNANQAGLDKYLFGQAATLLISDVWLLAAVTLVSFIVLLFFWKELKLLLFDEDYTKTLGFNVKFLDVLITSFIVLAIVLGLQTVGVVLMSAMLLAPAAAARQWTNKLWVMVLLAAIFGALSGVFGTAISGSTRGLSTGPVIVLVASSFVILSFIFSPERGILFKQIRKSKNRKELKLFKTLSLMYEIAQTHEDISHPHQTAILNDFQGYSVKALKELEEQKLIQLNGKLWNMTKDGYHKARQLFNQNSTDND